MSAATGGVPTAPANSVAATPRTIPKPTTIRVKTQGNFPAVGSLLGDYFCLGKLGKGTFCSIHKCADLKYWKNPTKGRLVAAKVELQNFANSGVLMGEAFMLQHLDQNLPPETVPIYHGHLVSGKAAAIVMEFLEGNDMHQLREALGSRRISVEDAVFLTADVFIPLLERMHEAGVVHRDVKPSNCVRKQDREFLLVDFGLSKSILVEKDSAHAGEQFNESHHFRQEREKADFRGTSMYASLRVHQLKDYTFRDDMWSVLYVFCDLVSGGLPWMSYAAARDRVTCEKMKEEAFEKKTADILLFGEEYHLMKYRRDKMQEEGRTDLPDLPEPLPLSKDASKVKLLQDAFDHLGSLSFTQKPNYEFLRNCLKGFLEGETFAQNSKFIKWKTSKSEPFSPTREKEGKWDSKVPHWDLFDVNDPIDVKEIWKDAQSQVDPEEYKGLVGDAGDFSLLPVEFHFRIAQMEYNTTHAEEVPPHITLRDFMKCALPLVYGDWNANDFEKHNHMQTGYRRETFLKVIDKCLKCASTFNYFSSKDCYYEVGENGQKRRKIVSEMGDLVAVAKTVFGLQQLKREEIKKRRAPPPALSFGS